MPAATQFREERAELQTVLSSGIFTRSPSLASFLQYVCDRYFEGQSETIKEYNVAVEALGRPSTFDQKKDSIVRVEAHRLRKRLQEYYKEQGADHEIQITLPSGNYVPQFRLRAETPALTSIVEVPEARLLQPPASADVTSESSLTLTNLPPSVIDAEPVLHPDRRPGWRMMAIVVALVCVFLLGIAFFRARPVQSEASTATFIPAIPFGEEVRIMAGSSAATLIDHYGQTWHGDQFFQGGDPVTVASRPIARSLDPSIFFTRREGDFSYHIPLKPGSYELHLYFAETLFGETNAAAGGESTRLFHVRINDKTVLSYFDVFADASGANVSDIKIFKDISPAADGKLHIQFAPTNKESPFVNAIEIVPSAKGKMRPVRIVARDSIYTDKLSQPWSADRYFLNGMMLRRHDPIGDTEDDELYRSERYGNFTYTIPVADSTRYTVTLKFCENWFGEGRPGGGGVGSRLFDVYVNGRTLLRNFDIYKEAGGGLRAYDRTFRGIEPTAQGKLFFQFVPVVNYALINGIEILDEGK